MDFTLRLMEFQEQGVERLAKARRAMLVWDPGVGKTPTAVRACVEAGARSVLVFCPPIARDVWRQHFEDWSNFGQFASQTLRIVPYSQMQGPVIRDGALHRPWDVVILDEAHYLKNPRAYRTQGIYGLTIDLRGSPLEEARHIWCLTGTPVLNHAAEFWTHLHALAPETIRMGRRTLDEEQFIRSFCVTRTSPHTERGYRVVGSRNTHELAARIRPFIDRKRLKDVLLDLPELRIVDHALPADTPISDELRQELVKASSLLGELDDEDLLEAAQNDIASFSTLRRLIGRAKVDAVAELIEDQLKDALDAKLIVFVHHREVIEALEARLKRAVLVIHGGTPIPQRDRAIKNFQTNPLYRVIILAIEAAGEAITLNAANNVIIAEPSPVPAKNFQAIARAHRKGQKNPVLARFVLLPGTLDHRLMSLIARKTREIAGIVDPDLQRPPSQKEDTERKARLALAFPSQE
jgi:SWI/SNF-related matrix-associated actin-dependent regulator of chromatin subfamily A-like protein 1